MGASAATAIAARVGAPSTGGGPVGAAAAPAGPERALGRFCAALDAGDLDAASSCFARDAYLVTPGATAIRGRGEIRAILAQLIARRTRIRRQAGGLLTVGDVALERGSWTLRSASAGGAVFEQILDPTVVLHRIEGAWKLAIAAPWR